MKYKYSKEQIENILSYEYWTILERKIIELHHKDGMAIIDTAVELDLSSSTVSRHISKIHKDCLDLNLI